MLPWVKWEAAGAFTAEDKIDGTFFFSGIPAAAV